LTTTECSRIKAILVETRTALAASSLNSLGVHYLSLGNHITLPHFPHHIKRLFALLVLLESAVLMYTGFTERSVQTILAYFMPITITILIQNSWCQHHSAANAASV
jgi:hypothetical protein